MGVALGARQCTSLDSRDGAVRYQRNAIHQVARHDGEGDAQTDVFVMSRTADEERAREEARFDRAQQRARQDEALKAKIAAEGQAVDKKTEGLRALRLARGGR